MLVPVVDHLCVVQSGRVHAAEWRRVAGKKSSRRRTVDTVCGLKRATRMCVEVTLPGFDLITATEQPSSGGVMVCAWPPPARIEGLDRCRDCWTATGRRRPADMFRQLKEADRADPS